MNPTPRTPRWLKWTAIAAFFVCLISLFGLVSFLYSRRSESLHAAARHGDLIAMQRALILQADVNDQTPTGQTPLHDATMADHPEAAEWLIEHGAAADMPDNKGLTPLQLAMVYSRHEVMKSLLSHGASTNVGDKYGRLPLEVSTASRDTTAALLLIRAGADLSIKTSVKSVESGRQNPMSVDMIQFAAYADLPLVIRELIVRGADPDEVNGSRSDSVSPLVLALVRNNLESAQVLIEKGANPNRITPGNRTPVFYAAGDSTSRTLEWLLPRVNNINIKTTDDETPLYEAVAHANIAAVKTLLKHGADPNIRAKSGNLSFTPLEYARQLDLKEIVKVLEAAR